MEDAVWMEMRREMERLKATVAELGRRIEDQADAEATPLRVEAGNGIEVQEAGGAWRVSAAAAADEERPMPFDVRMHYDATENAWLLQAWLPAEQTMLVARNGVSAINDEFAGHVEDGWVDVATLGEAPTGILLVTVDIQSTPVDESVEYSWRFVVGAPEETGIDWLDYPVTNRFAEVIIRRNDTPTLVAVVVGTAVVQYHRGAISTFGMDVDSLDSDNRSLAVIEQLQAYQLWKFDDPDYRMVTPIDVSDTEHYDRVQILIRQRGDDLVAAGDGPMVLQYASLGVIAEALVDAITTPHDDYKPEPSPWREAWDAYVNGRIENLMGGGDIEEIIEGNAARIYDLLKPYIDDDFWQTGGNYTTCWGSSIGNAGGAGEGVVIDLANYMLMRSTGIKTVDWEAMELWTTKLSIDWADRLMWDGAEKKSIDWSTRLLHDDAGIKTVDWNNCQAFASYNGWLSIDWEAMQLYSHVLEYGPPVKSLDWSACTTYDAAGNTTMSWRVRQLMGAWSIASGGSFATPSLELNGTTVSGVATVAVVTGVDFVNQTVTTANIKVLT